MESAAQEIDELTGLHGQPRLAEVYENERRRPGSLVGVVRLDLDGFEQLNETRGHEVGDQVLVGAADRLRSVCRGQDVAGRVGGDEFVVVLTGVAGVDEVLSVGERLVASMAAPFPVYDGDDVVIGASVGAAMSGVDQDDLDSIMQEVIDALYAAKQAGGGRLVMFGVRD